MVGLQTVRSWDHLVSQSKKRYYIKTRFRLKNIQKLMIRIWKLPSVLNVHFRQSLNFAYLTYLLLTKQLVFCLHLIRDMIWELFLLPKTNNIYLLVQISTSLAIDGTDIEVEQWDGKRSNIFISTLDRLWEAKYANFQMKKCVNFHLDINKS